MSVCFWLYKMGSVIILTLLGACLIGLDAATAAGLPDSVKVDSYLTYSNRTKFERFKITEYVDMQDGSIRMDVLNVTSPPANEDNPSTTDRMSYFRLLSKNDRDDEVLDNRMTSYDSDKGRCSDVHIQAWPLRNFSRLMTELKSVRHKLIDERDCDKTFQGPAGLLRLVHNKSELFSFASAKSDADGIGNEQQVEHHFWLTLKQWNDKAGQVAKLIVKALSATGGSERPAPLDENPPLAQLLEAGARVSTVALVVLPPESSKELASLDRLGPAELLDQVHRADSFFGGAIVTYVSVQERSLTRHTGLEYLAAAAVAEEVDSPFLLPVGLGCGSAWNGRPFVVKATQFSGSFEATDYDGRFFAAYDEASNHLRYDMLGEYKMVYALNDDVVTYVAEHSQGSRPNSATTLNSGSTQTHCAQASLAGERGPPPLETGLLYKRKKLESVLGLGELVGLVYLGRTELPNIDHNGQFGAHEPVPCLVFERSVSFAQIPALLHMHLRLQPREKNHFALVYYFVDEINSVTRTSLFNEQLHAYESMWLKRVELLSRHDYGKYVLSNAQLTFSKSSWSLETRAQEGHDRETQLEHPVRSFDLLECWPERGTTQLELVLERRTEEQWQERGLESYYDSSLPVQLLESFEESLMDFVSRQIGFPRSQVNDFTLLAVAQSEPPKTSPTIGDGDQMDGALQIRSKLTFPFKYAYKENLVGWVENYQPLLALKQAKMVSLKYMVLYHECSLKLATQATRNQYKFHMLFCPNLGCGLLLVEPSKLMQTGESNNTSEKSNFHSAGETSGRVPLNSRLSIFFDMCEVYLVSKLASPRGLISADHRAQMVAGSLTQAALSIDSYKLNADTRHFELVHYRAQVSKVALKSGASWQSLGHDEIVVPGLCYTTKTRMLINEAAPYTMANGNGSLRIKRLLLDKHHSRAHCRLACSMFEYCETYSYSHGQRACHLTNINGELLRDPLITLEEVETGDTPQQDCAIYSLDKLVLFKRRPAPLMRAPLQLLAHHGDQSQDSILLWANLDKCAGLAHSSAWSLASSSARNPLGAFAHMGLKQLCVLNGIERHEFMRQFAGQTEGQIINNQSELEDHIGSNWNQSLELEAYEIYDRDLERFYLKKLGYHVEIEGVASEGGSLLGRKQLSFGECLEACSLKEQGCVMFDFCSGSMTFGQHESSCSLYSIRSPFAIERLARLMHQKLRHSLVSEPRLKLNTTARELASSPPLTPLEEALYLEEGTAGAATSGELLVEVRHVCQHFYLAGDNLLAKRLLQAEQQADKQTANKAARSEKSASRLHLNILALLAQALAGLALGFGLFIGQPTILALVKSRGGQVDEVERDPSRAQRRLGEIRRALFAGARRRAPPAASATHNLELNEIKGRH